MSTKQEQILKIDPPVELTFTGPFHQAVSSVMTLTNPSDRKVCFKIKTTAPKRYCVKPNSGVIDPTQTVQIAVSLQPFDFDPQDKNRHKFMVQSMFAPPGEINQESLWKEADGSQLMDSKLKCLFLLPESNGGVDDGNSGPWPSAGIGSGNGDSVPIKQEKDESIAVNTGSVSATSSVPANDRQSDMIVSRPAGGDAEVNLRQSVEEIKKLNEEISAARQDNLQLKEKVLRLERLGNTMQDPPSTRPTGQESYTLHARNPDADSLSTTYLYLALLVLIIGIILGKFVF